MAPERDVHRRTGGIRATAYRRATAASTSSSLPLMTQATYLSMARDSPGVAGIRGSGKHNCDG